MICVSVNCSASALLVFAKGVDRIRLPAEYVITEVCSIYTHTQGGGDRRERERTLCIIVSMCPPFDVFVSALPIPPPVSTGAVQLSVPAAISTSSLHLLRLHLHRAVQDGPGHLPTDCILLSSQCALTSSPLTLSFYHIVRCVL